MDTGWLRRYRLIGNENTEVGIECRDHFDDGRPLAFYSDDPKAPYRDDPKVQNVSTIPGLLAAAQVHEHEMHGEAESRVTNVHIQGSPAGIITERELARRVQVGLRDR